MKVTPNLKNLILCSFERIDGLFFPLNLERKKKGRALIRGEALNRDNTVFHLLDSIIFS